MSEEYENYGSMMEEVEKRVGAGDLDGKAPSNDAPANAWQLQQRIETMSHQLEDLQARIQRIEERLGRS